MGTKKHHVRTLWRACVRPSMGDPGDNPAKPCRGETGQWWQKAAVFELTWLPLYTQASEETWGYVCIYVNEHKYIKILTEFLLVTEWPFAPCYLFVCWDHHIHHKSSIYWLFFSNAPNELFTSVGFLEIWLFLFNVSEQPFRSQDVPFQLHENLYWFPNTYIHMHVYIYIFFLLLP